MLRQQEERVRKEMQAESAANEHLYSERLSALQHSRELVQIERDALAVERQQLLQNSTGTGCGSGSGSRSDLATAAAATASTVDGDDAAQPSALMAMLRQFGRRPSDEQLQHIDRQLAAVRQRGCGRYEFAQRQVPAGLGVYKAVVTIADTQLGLVAEWPPARLDVWLERLREATPPVDTWFDGFEVVWCRRDEYEQRCVDLDVQADRRSTASSGCSSGRTSLAGAAAVGRAAGRGHVDAALLRTALANQQQQNSEALADLSKRRLRYDATPDQKGRSQERLQAENVEPAVTKSPDGVKRSTKFVRMVVD